MVGRILKGAALALKITFVTAAVAAVLLIMWNILTVATYREECKAACPRGWSPSVAFQMPWEDASCWCSESASFKLVVPNSERSHIP